MAYRSGFFNAKQNIDGSYDRTYDANDISNYLGGLALNKHPCRFKLDQVEHF